MGNPYDYSGGDGRRYHQHKRDVAGDSAAYDWISEARKEKLRPWIKPADRVLELGVGGGWNLAKVKCRERVGHDLASHLKPLVEMHGVRFIEKEADIPLGYFDAVLCHHMLEHVVDPYGTLKRIATWLRPGGRLVLYVPYEYERKFLRFNHDDKDHHLFSWNVQTAAALIESAGFVIHEATTGPFGYDRFAAKLAMRIAPSYFGYKLIRGALLAGFGGREVVVVAHA